MVAGYIRYIIIYKSIKMWNGYLTVDYTLYSTMENYSSTVAKWEHSIILF